MLKQLKHLTKKDWFFAFLICVFVVGDVFCELKIPEYMQQIVVTIKSGGTINDILLNGLKMLMFAVLAIVAVIIAKFFSSRVAIGLGKRIRSKVFNKVIDFSDAELKRFSTPSLITRTTNDIVQVQSIVAMGLTLLVKAPVMSVMAIIKIVNTNLAWTLATAIAVGIIFVTLLIITFVAIPRFKRVQILTDNLNKVSRESLTGTRVVRAFNGEEYQQNKLEKANKDITDNHLFISKTMSLIDPTMTIVMNGLPLAVYIIGSILIYNAGIFDKLTILANMTVFGSYSIQVILSLR